MPTAALRYPRRACALPNMGPRKMTMTSIPSSKMKPKEWFERLCYREHGNVSGLTRLSGMNAQGPDADGAETNLSTCMTANVMKIRDIEPPGAHPVVHPM